MHILVGSEHTPATSVCAPKGLIWYVDRWCEVKVPGEAKRNNQPPECGQPIDGGVIGSNTSGQCVGYINSSRPYCPKQFCFLCSSRAFGNKTSPPWYTENLWGLLTNTIASMQHIVLFLWGSHDKAKNFDVTVETSGLSKRLEIHTDTSKTDSTTSWTCRWTKKAI
jgi:hypothetical protein